MNASEGTPTEERLKRELAVQKRITQAAINSNAHWEDVSEFLVWDRPEDQYDEPISEAHMASALATYPQFADDIRDFVKLWNADPRITDEMLDAVEVKPEDLERGARRAIQILDFYRKLRRIEGERDDLERKLRTAEAELGKADKTTKKWCQKALAEKWQAEAEIEKVLANDKLRQEAAKKVVATAEERVEKAESDLSALRVERDELKRMMRVDSIHYGAGGCICRWNEEMTEVVKECLHHKEQRETAEAAAKLLDFYNAHPRLVGFAEGYGDSKGVWMYSIDHVAHEATSLRDAIDRALNLSQPEKGDSATEKKWCTYCKKDNHNDNECWSTRPGGWKAWP